MTAASTSPATRRRTARPELAYVELASSEVARDINRDIVLEFVRARQPISRADLARCSGLQPSTVSNIVDQLLKEKWIAEGAVVRRPRGRRPTLLSLNDDLVILVADIRPRRAILAVVDLNGRMLAREEVRVFTDAERSINAISDAIETMRERFPTKSFEGVGISLPGRVHPRTQRLIMAPNLNWADVDLKGTLEKRLRLQVELDNAANASLLSELWFGRMDGIHNAVLISVSEGLGTAILSNGQIVSGMNGLAGEFGHIPIDPAGPLCGCGQRGCWETFASSTAALRFHDEAAPDSGVRNIEELLRRTEEGDAQAIAAVERQARHLGHGLRLITAALSPELILITGALTTCWARFGPMVQAELTAGMLAGEAPRLEVTTEGDSARLRGGAAIVLQRHSGYHRAGHVGKKTRTA